MMSSYDKYWLDDLDGSLQVGAKQLDVGPSAQAEVTGLHDSPNVGLNGAEVTGGEIYVTYLMYKPGPVEPGAGAWCSMPSIWVPVQQMTWTWSGSAKLALGLWSLNRNIPSSSPRNPPKAVPGSAMPEWSTFSSRYNNESKWPQQCSISGTVTWAGVPIPGATVKATWNHDGASGVVQTTTNQNGEYLLKAGFGSDSVQLAASKGSHAVQEEVRPNGHDVPNENLVLPGRP
jgi:hypothetical protein